MWIVGCWVGNWVEGLEVVGEVYVWSEVVCMFWEGSEEFGGRLVGEWRGLKFECVGVWGLVLGKLWLGEVMFFVFLLIDVFLFRFL